MMMRNTLTRVRIALAQQDAWRDRADQVRDIGPLFGDALDAAKLWALQAQHPNRLRGDLSDLSLKVERRAMLELVLDLAADLRVDGAIERANQMEIWVARQIAICP